MSGVLRVTAHTVMPGPEMELYPQAVKETGEADALKVVWGNRFGWIAIVSAVSNIILGVLLFNEHSRPRDAFLLKEGINGDVRAVPSTKQPEATRL